MPLSACSDPGTFCISVVVFLGWRRDGPSSQGGEGWGWVNMWKQFPTKRKKILLLLHVCQCCGVVDISPRCQTSGIILGGGSSVSEVDLCFSFLLSFPHEHGAAHSALSALGLPSVHAAEESSQATASELCSPALSCSPKGADSLLALGPLCANPIRSQQIHVGSEFLSTVAPDHQSLHTASNTFLPWKQLFHGN